MGPRQRETGPRATDRLSDDQAITRSLPRRLPVRPDLWAAYPDPRLSLRHATPYGLTVDELRAEWKRQVDAGWARWELDLRLHPAEVAA
jgi:hypothetical protein